MTLPHDDLAHDDLAMMTLPMMALPMMTWLMQRSDQLGDQRVRLNRRPLPGKSRAVINAIQTRTADRLQAQRFRMLARSP